MKSKLKKSTKCIRCGTFISALEWQWLKEEDSLPICDECGEEDLDKEVDHETLYYIATLRFNNKYPCMVCNDYLVVEGISTQGKEKGFAHLKCNHCSDISATYLIFSEKNA